MSTDKTSALGLLLLLAACTGGTAKEVDADGDGYNETDDCDDDDPAIHPDATEICDGADNNCDSGVDEGLNSTFYGDADGDGFGDAANTAVTCAAPDGYVSNGSDCDDQDDQVYPDAAEVCDELDNNCDGQADEGVRSTFYADMDGDSFGDPDNTTDACEASTGYVENGWDCDDQNEQVYPDGAEICDELDNDCDGLYDEEVQSTWYADADGDGFGDATLSYTGCEMPGGYAEADTDCDDTDPWTYPGALELCDGVQNSCDADWESDAGVATWVGDDGAVTDLTDTLGAGLATEPAELTLDEAGTLTVCAGTWYAALTVDADVTIQGLDGADTTILSGGDVATPLTVGEVTADVSGLTLTEGVATTTMITYGGTDQGGGAVFCQYGTLSLTDVVVRDSTAKYGGGIAAEYCTLTISGASIYDNTSTRYGGGLWTYGTTGTVTDSTFEGNSAAEYGGAALLKEAEIDVSGSTFTDNASSVDGGAIAADEWTGTLSSLTFTGNTATDRGAAIFFYEAVGALESSIFESNSANYGAGFTAIDTTLTVTGSTFTSNSVTGLGGAIYTDSMDGSISGSEFTGNSAVSGGGAIRLYEGTVELSDLTVSGNSATGSGAEGGGLITHYTALTVTDATFSTNTSTNNGGGLFLAYVTEGTMSGLTVSGNSASGDGGGLYTIYSYPDISDSTFTANDAGDYGGAFDMEQGGGSFTNVTVDSNTGYRFTGGVVGYNPETVTFTGCTFSNNVADYDGGGLSITYGDIAVYDTVFSGNVALGRFAGGMALYYGDVVLEDVSFEDNDGFNTAGAIYHNRGVTLTATSCDFSGNAPNDVYSELSGVDTDLGSDVSFTCNTSSGCSF